MASIVELRSAFLLTYGAALVLGTAIMKVGPVLFTAVRGWFKEEDFHVLRSPNKEPIILTWVVVKIMVPG